MRELKQVAEDNAELQSMDPTQALAAFRQVGDLQREYARILGSSDTDYRQWMAQLLEIRKANPFAEVFLPLLDKVTERTHAFMVTSAMAAAGLAVIRDGKDALMSHPDPVTGEPFAYTETADGFELQSNSSYQIAGKPLKLSFK